MDRRSLSRGFSLKNFAISTLTRGKSIGEETFGSSSNGLTIEDQHPYLHEYYSSTADVIARNVMVVVDTTKEAKGALLWALSHALVKDDKLILLHIVKPCFVGSSRKGNESPFHSTQVKRQKNPKDTAFLNSLKALCKQLRPEVEVELMTVRGRDKASTILHRTKKHSVSLLVLGQSKSTFLRRLRVLLSGGRCRGGSDGGGIETVVDYCIQNSECMSVAVTRKSPKGGGYLITTKSQKNFWLLA
ncbi:hypothetical protein KI387_035913 [Taxus chinensis]|uniref:UspA domain-containing protein n=1 Tax=Taxus chinensis TaxID=29808 RepID=A0AA38L183_TAXCH|nr:hypothetical protein KI387_035913 [Taxus chinensis]